MCVVSGRKGPGRRFYASWLPGERCISRATVMMATEDVRGTYCQLLSGSCLHSPINLPDGTVVSVGREPKTKIKSKKCSRRQVELVANYITKEVTLNVVGKNPSIVANEKLKKGSQYTLGSGGRFELVSGCTYHIFFGSEMPQDPPCQFGILEEDETCKRMKIEDDVKEMDYYERETLLVYKYGSQSPSEKIAGFDLDGTIIETASGKKFATNYSDWKLMPNVKQKLQQCHIKGFRIVIFTNQGGMARGKPTKDDFTKKISSIAETLEVPIIVFVAPGQDIYRKPCTGMWSHLLERENLDTEPNLSLCFYVGDAAGREANWRPGAKKDFSCTDRKFALNIGISFSTPEEFFLGYSKCNKFTFGNYDPRSYNISNYRPSTDPADALLTLDKSEVVVFVGLPASGKSTFFEEVMKPKGYVHINRDTLGSWQKCVSMCQQELKKRRKVVIDNTNPDVESRQRYVGCSQQHGVQARCFLFKTPIEQAKHNNKFRELIATTKHAKVNEIAFNTFKSKFVEPTVSEGFKQVVKITLTPSVRAEYVTLYQQFLL